MIITYLRSSSIGTWMWCPQKYFLAYNLGYQEPSNKKADKGTICHKVFELLAVARKAELEQEKTFNDEILGDDIPLRVVDDLEWLTTKVYDYYTALMTNHEWTDADYRECFRWVKKALLYNNGAFDPRNLNVVAPESRFDIEVKQSWAKYILRGEEGYLRLKGTIDLVTEPTPGTFEIIDWKGLPVETPIPTPNGWTTMGRLQVGDTVYDKDGQSTKVIGKSKPSFKPCYELEFDGQMKVVCDNEHLWLLSSGKVTPVTELKCGDEIDVAANARHLYNYDRHKITNITLLSIERETQCIMVDSPSNTYLCTENMIPTHNTGRRLNWATGQEKDYNSLRNDIQLRMYHYAMAQQYPQAENLIFTIFYINDGGPWSIPFQKSDLITTEGMLRKHFQDIRDSELPALNKSWKCTKLCHFGKTRYPGSSQTMCEFIHSEIKKKGMEKILRDYTRKGYDVTKYKAPGEVE